MTSPVVDASVEAPAAEPCVMTVVRRWRFPRTERHTMGTAIVRLSAAEPPSAVASSL